MMPDIYHDFQINASAEKVFDLISSPDGIAKWWSDGGSGRPAAGNTYLFDFGPGYEWEAVVEECEPAQEFSLKMTNADKDWTGTTVRFLLSSSGSGTLLRFSHTGWPEDNDHFRSSSYCWAMYLRCLKLYAETGRETPYMRRLEVG